MSRRREMACLVMSRETWRQEIAFSRLIIFLETRQCPSQKIGDITNFSSPMSNCPCLREDQKRTFVWDYGMGMGMIKGFR